MKRNKLNRKRSIGNYHRKVQARSFIYGGWTNKNDSDARRPTHTDNWTTGAHQAVI